MVTRQSKLRTLLFYSEIGHLALAWELVTQAVAIIKKADADIHLARSCTLREVYQQLVVVVADRELLTPYGLPSLVKGAVFDRQNLETVEQIL